MSGVTCVSLEPTIYTAQKLMRCEPLTHHIHIQFIHNNLKRGLVLLTHQLLSSPIIEYNTLGIMHNGCDRQLLHTSLIFRQSQVPCSYVSFRAVGSNETLLLVDIKYIQAEQYTFTSLCQSNWHGWTSGKLHPFVMRISVGPHSIMVKCVFIHICDTN